MSEDAVGEALRPQAAGIVRAAVAAAGNAENITEWKDRVYALVGAIGTMMTPQREPDALEMALWALQSTAFTGTFVKAEYDTKTKRLMVSFKSETSEDGGLDVVRTEPDWTPLGAAMQRRVLAELTPGDHCKVFKHIEQVDAKRKVRMLVHFDILRRAGSGEASRPAQASAPAVDPRPAPPPEQAPPAREAPVTRQSPEPAGLLADEGPSVKEMQQANRAALDAAQQVEAELTEMRAVEAAINDLVTNGQNKRLVEVKVSAMARSKNIKSWAMPTAEELPVVLAIIESMKENK